MDAVRDWNAKYAYPKLIIATTSEAFHEFEKRYGAKLPTYRGDFTPYWEDGTGSAARETALNRHSADRLLQAETLWALAASRAISRRRFRRRLEERGLVERAHLGRVQQHQRTRIARSIKDAVEVQAGLRAGCRRRSRTHLLDKALGGAPAAAMAGAVDVFNTASWPRTDLVTLPKGTEGSCVKDDGGVPSPRNGFRRASWFSLPATSRRWPPGGL